MGETSARPLPSGVEWSGGYTSADEIAAIVLAETRKLAKGTKLTWNPDRLPVAGKAKMIGKELCLSLPFVMVEKRYYIQNSRVFLSNGVRVTLDEVEEREGSGGTWLRVKEALDNYNAMASVASDSLCKHCFAYEAPSYELYTQHMIDVHADILAKKIKGEDPAEEPDPSLLVCECGKEWGSPQALRMHNMKKHTAA